MNSKICTSLDNEGLVYDITDENSVFQLTIVHKFSEVNTKIDELSYYITLNGDRTFYLNYPDQDQDQDQEQYSSNIYQPELLSTTQNSEYEYVSVYLINLLRLEITFDSSDSVKLNLILPFDHCYNLLDLKLTKTI
jgi:hypothetical protein